MIILFFLQYAFPVSTPVCRLEYPANAPSMSLDCAETF
jgi:hypothetical protein